MSTSSGLVSSLNAATTGSATSSKSSPEESSTSSSGMNSAASLSVEDALSKLGLSEDDETTSSRSLPHSSEPANPAKKKATSAAPNAAQSRVYRKKLSIENEFVFGGIVRRELSVPQDRAFLKVRDVKTEFENLRPLGTGTFGKVFLMRHVSSNQVMACKRVSKAAVFRFRQETRILHEREYLRAIDSPFVVRLYGTHSDEMNLYFFLEYLPGGELFTRIQTGHDGHKGLKVHHARFYLSEIVLAFEYLHKCNIVYRDLKPENVMIDAEGHIRLVDLGFALQIAIRSYSICGTTEYMSPEMVQGRGSGYGADWWALGILLYEMIVGRTPFRGPDKMATYKRIIQDDVLFPELFPSRSAKHLIVQLLNKDSAARLGCTNEGIDGIKRHAFFFEVDWTKCQEVTLCALDNRTRSPGRYSLPLVSSFGLPRARQLRVRTPWVPKLKSLLDTRNFCAEGQDFSDPTYTMKDLGITEADAKLFDGF